jgi:hypothetical protein
VRQTATQRWVGKPSKLETLDSHKQQDTSPKSPLFLPKLDFLANFTAQVVRQIRAQSFDFIKKRIKKRPAKSRAFLCQMRSPQQLTIKPKR